MSRLEVTLNTDFSFHAEQRSLAGDRHASLVYGSYADWPVRIRALTARAAGPGARAAAFNYAAAVTQR